MEISGDESELTPPQREVLTHLQKLLMTLNRINEQMLSMIELTKEDGELINKQKAAVSEGKDAFEGVLGIENEVEVRADGEA